MKIKMFRTIILSLVLYGSETWSLVLREVRSLRMLENRNEVTGDWRRLHNEELNDLQFSSSMIRVIKSRRIGSVWQVSCKEERKDAYRVLLGKPGGKRLLARPRL
jgi:hypothetical protein